MAILILQKKIGTGAALFDITNLTYNGVNYDFTVDSTVTGLAFSPDGSKIFIGERNDIKIFQYDLSTSWDITSATFTADKFIALNGAIHGLTFSPDGTRMYYTDDTLNAVREYILLTPWTITSLNTTPSHTFPISDQDIQPKGLEFSPDGTNMYLIGDANRTIYQYTLSTPWVLNTASYSTNSFYIPTDAAPHDVNFSNDGLKMFVIAMQGGKLYQFNLSTAWDISTAVYNNINSVLVAILPSEGYITETTFNPIGTKVFALGVQTTTIFQLDLT